MLVRTPWTPLLTWLDRGNGSQEMSALGLHARICLRPSLGAQWPLEAAYFIRVGCSTGLVLRAVPIHPVHQMWEEGRADAQAGPSWRKCTRQQLQGYSVVLPVPLTQRAYLMGGERLAVCASMCIHIFTNTRYPYHRK